MGFAGSSTGNHTVLARSSVLSRITSADPQILTYAVRVFGTTDLTEDQWKQCMDQVKVYKYHIMVICRFSLFIFSNNCVTDAICLPRNATEKARKR